MLFYRDRLPLSRRTLNLAAHTMRNYRRATGSRCRRLDAGQQALIVLRTHGPVAAVQGGDHRARGRVQRGEQGRRTCADVIMGLALGHRRHHRQHRGRAVQRLDLGLLVHTENQRVIGRVQVEAGDVADLLDEKRGRWTAFIRPPGAASIRRRARSARRRSG